MTPDIWMLISLSVLNLGALWCAGYSGRALYYGIKPTNKRLAIAGGPLAAALILHLIIILVVL